MTPQPEQKAGTPFEKFRQFAKQIVAVPKAEIDRREKAYKKARKHKAKPSL
jgi:hypothetical protein